MVAFFGLFGTEYVFNTSQRNPITANFQIPLKWYSYSQENDVTFFLYYTIEQCVSKSLSLPSHIFEHTPHDPIFWFHHSFVDKIWADFYNTLSTDEKNAISDYPDNEMPFFDKKATEIKDIKIDQRISYQGLLKDRSLVSNP